MLAGLAPELLRRPHWLPALQIEEAPNRGRGFDIRPAHTFRRIGSSCRASGGIRLRLSRPIEGKLKSVTVKSGAPVAGFVPRPHRIQEPRKPAGSRRGCARFHRDRPLDWLGSPRSATARPIPPPRFAARDAARLRRAARALNRKQPGGHATGQATTARSAPACPHRGSPEGLPPRELSPARSPRRTAASVSRLSTFADSREPSCRKSVLDAGLGEVLCQLEYKADWTGKPFVAVGRFYVHRSGVMRAMRRGELHPRPVGAHLALCMRRDPRSGSERCAEHPRRGSSPATGRGARGHFKCLWGPGKTSERGAGRRSRNLREGMPNRFNPVQPIRDW